MNSILTDYPIQLWNAIKEGDIVGNPTFGNNFNDLNFKNSGNLNLKIDILIDKIIDDIGEEKAKKLKTIRIIPLDGEFTVFLEISE